MVKDIIIDKKNINYLDCAHIVSCILLSKQKKSEEKNQDNKSQKKNRDEENIKRRVYDALNILISASIFRRSNKVVSLIENTFHRELKKQHCYTGLIQLNKIKYKRLELVGMIKKYAIVKNIIERNKANPCNEKINVPFSMVHRADGKSGKVKLESTENCKAYTVMSGTNLILRGDLNALLSSKMCQEISRSKFDKYVDETKVAMKSKLGSYPTYLDTQIPM